MIVIFALVGIGLIIWAIGSAREEAREVEQRQTALNEYTDQLRGALEGAGQPIGELSNAAAPDKDTLSGLEADAGAWAESIQEVQAGLTQVFPTPEVQSVHELFNEALSLYVTSARTFQQIPAIDSEATQQELFTQAATVRDTARAVFQSAVGVLDQLRDEAELGASGISVPGGQAEQPQPIETGDGSTTIEIPSEPEDGGGGGDDEGDAGNDGGGG
jgi:hypothetical protein